MIYLDHAATTPVPREVADTMYGVTIEDAGVSKILSVKLEDYQQEN